MTVLSTAMVKNLIFKFRLKDYLRKIIVQGRSSKTTKVGDIMTEEVSYMLHHFLFCFIVNEMLPTLSVQLDICERG